MAYVYLHFIPQNTAPKGTKRIGVYKDGKKVATIPLGRMTPPAKEKLYSFGIVSDTHMGYNSYTDKTNPLTVGTSLEDGMGYGQPPNGTNLRKALEYMVEQGCLFVCNGGDLTNIGFYFARGDTELYPYQFQEYRDICALFPSLQVYNVMGNHESYNSDIVNNLDDLEEYTGTREIAFYFERGDDVFLIVGQSASTIPMTEAHLQWLTDRLAEFKDRRCFVFIHSFMRNDSGSACGARENDIFSMSWGENKTNSFKQMLAKYPNVVLFHGHSHMKFESQEYDVDATYTEKNGFKSVHIPSLGDPRKLTGADGSWEEDKYGGQFYVVDVYDDCIVLNGMYVYRENRTTTVLKIVPIPLGVYKIDT